MDAPEPSPELATASALKAIRAKCLDCAGGMPSEVRECQISRCALHPFRMGKRPKKARQGLPAEAKAALLARLGGARAASLEKQEETGRDERLAP
jgi:hypothetical protein